MHGVVSGAEVRVSQAPVVPIVATLTLPYPRVLPGVPVDLSITLKNVSNRPVTVGLISRVIVTLPDGSVFPPTGTPAERNDRQELEPYGTSSPLTSIELAAGESIERVINWDRAAPKNWSHASAYSGPGNYDLQVELERGMRDEEPNYVGVIRTSSARLERVVPVGEDETLWARMQAVSSGRWCDSAFASTKAGAALAEEIVQLHPTSGYYPYALLLRNYARQKEDIPLSLDAADRFRDSPALPYLLSAAGDAALYEAKTSYRANHDVDKAKKFYDLAETYYRDALKTNSTAIRGVAQRNLDDITARREKLAADNPKRQ
jgi:hypothetical protein